MRYGKAGGKLGELNRRVGGRIGSVGGSVKAMGIEVVSVDGWVEEESGDGVDVAHHAARAVNNFEIEREKVLGPATKLMVVPVVGVKCLDGGAVGDPDEFAAPEELAETADSPAAGSSFADVGVVMSFTFVADAGEEFDGTEAGSV